MGEETITLGRYTIEVSHPDKMMYPEDGITIQDHWKGMARNARTLKL